MLKSLYIDKLAAWLKFSSFASIIIGSCSWNELFSCVFLNPNKSIAALEMLAFFGSSIFTVLLSACVYSRLFNVELSANTLVRLVSSSNTVNVIICESVRLLSETSTKTS